MYDWNFSIFAQGMALGNPLYWELKWWKLLRKLTFEIRSRYENNFFMLWVIFVML